MGQLATETTRNRTRTFTYDPQRQLTAVLGTLGSDTESYNYAYDGIGNRTTFETSSTAQTALEQGKTTYTVNGVNQYTAMVGARADTPQYDQNGNTTSLRGMTLKFDDENRLVQSSDANGTIAYVYDGLNRRLERTEIPIAGGVTITHYVYDGWRVIDNGTAAEIFRGIMFASQNSATSSGGLRAMTRQKRIWQIVDDPTMGPGQGDKSGGLIRFRMGESWNKESGVTNYPLYTLAHEIGHAADGAKLLISSRPRDAHRRTDLTDEERKLGGRGFNADVEGFAVAFANRVSLEIAERTSRVIGYAQSYDEPSHGHQPSPLMPPPKIDNCN